MAVIRNTVQEYDEDDVINYFATAALFCGVALVVVMLKFGFRATMDLGSNNKKKDSNDVMTTATSNGVYRVYKNEFFDNGNLSDPPKKISPTMVKLPNSAKIDKPDKPLLSSKSTNDIRAPSGSTDNNTNLSKSATNLTQQGTPEKTKPVKKITPTKEQKANEKLAKNQEKELKKLEKQRLAEQKKKDKKEAAEILKLEKENSAKEAKLKKEKEKAEKERLKKQGKDKTKVIPVPVDSNRIQVTSPLAKTTNPLAQTSNQMAKPAQGYSTNTLESSISHSSGPPPYTKESPQAKVANQRDTTGNTSFSKPLDDDSSWDFISQHRQQINRPNNVNATAVRKGTTLQYSVGRVPAPVDDKDSEV